MCEQDKIVDIESKKFGDKELNDKIYQPVPMVTKQVEDDEKEPTANELRERAMDELKKNLLFDQKDISIWKLY